jgi:hypothetical protein
MVVLELRSGGDLFWQTRLALSDPWTGLSAKLVGWASRHSHSRPVGAHCDSGWVCHTAISRHWTSKRPGHRWRHREIGPHNHGRARLSTKVIAYELFERLMARSFQRKSWMGVERYVPALIRSVPAKPNYPIFSSPESDQR